MRPTSAVAAAAVLALLAGGVARAAPAAPSGVHPRLFLTGARLDAAKQNATTAGTASKALVDRCQQTITTPGNFADRGGADGNKWPDAAVACAFSWLTTGNATHAAQGIKYWRASLEDDQNIGDKLGCVENVSTSWSSWNGSTAAPPVIITVTHDTGYPMRWYGPFIALAYDWLHDAPGVTEALRAQTRTCLGTWLDYYTQRGYLAAEPGANYNAGFVAGKALAAIALGGEAGATGDRIWAETVDTLFAQVLVAKGLAGRSTGVGTPAGALLGGDWPEGWQYGPLSVAEYAAAARALVDAGVPQPELAAWTDSLVVRGIHGAVPALDGQWVGGDFEGHAPYQTPSQNQLDAVLLGPSSDAAAGWAARMKQLQPVSRSTYVWNALAETRTVTPTDYRQSSPPLWYLSRGTRAVYARTAWDAAAYWTVFSSPPHIVADHMHHAAGNFVFSRGVDHLVVDPSNYGEPGTLETNAIAVDSPLVAGRYAPSQTPWSKAELLWARQASGSATVGARSDFAGAFTWSGGACDVPYARRDFTFLPEGEIVLVDRVRTGSDSRSMYLSVHANTGGTLALGGDGAAGRVGGARLVIHRVAGAGTPAILQPAVVDTYSFPCGNCTNARFAVDDYTLKVAGPWAVAIHVLDGLGASEDAAVVASLNDPVYDPPPSRNGGIIGAAVYRGQRQSFVVASSAEDGAAGATLTYRVPGGSAARHVVYDAPEDGSGRSSVTATAAGGACAITITAGSGVAGHPLMFSVGPASGGCAVSEDTNVPAAGPPPTPSPNPVPLPNPGGSAHGRTGGCGTAACGLSSLALLALALVAARRAWGRAWS